MEGVIATVLIVLGVLAAAVWGAFSSTLSEVSFD